MKTNWTQNFPATLTIRLKPADLKAFQAAAQDDLRSTQDWIRLTLRAAARPYFPKDDRPPLPRVVS
jgi:hypothetical protein